MDIIKRTSDNKWSKIIKLNENYCIKCQTKDQLLKVLKFFEDYTQYKFEDTKERVSTTRPFSDSCPTYIITDHRTETLYTSLINPFSSMPTYSTAFLQQTRLLIDK